MSRNTITHRVNSFFETVILRPKYFVYNKKRYRFLNLSNRLVFCELPWVQDNLGWKDQVLFMVTQSYIGKVTITFLWFNNSNDNNKQNHSTNYEIYVHVSLNGMLYYYLITQDLVLLSGKIRINLHHVSEHFHQPKSSLLRVQSIPVPIYNLR